MKAGSSQSFEEALLSRVKAHFTDKYGSRKPPIPLSYGLYYAACILLSLSLPIATLLKIAGVFATDSDFALFCVLSIATGIGSSLTFMGFAHALSHNALSIRENSFLGECLKFLCWDCIVTISEYIWDNVHNKSHHSYTNMRIGDVEKDLDVILITNNLRRQKSYFVIGLMIMAAQTIRFFRQFKSLYTLHKNYETIHFPELLRIIAGKIYDLLVYFILPVWAFQSASALAFGFIFLTTQSLILVPIFLIAHTNADVKFYAVPGPKPYDAISFHRLQIESSANFSTNNKLMNWLTGGLTYQIEHHAFPDHHPHFYPELAAIIQDECQKHDIHYMAYPSYAAGFRAFMKFLGEGQATPPYEKPPVTIRPRKSHQRS